jgi:hypothetical protein
MAVSSMDEQVLRASKEIIVKFIEVGKVSPTSFAGAFKDIYTAIDETVKGAAPGDEGKEPQSGQSGLKEKMKDKAKDKK